MIGRHSLKYNPKNERFRIVQKIDLANNVIEEFPTIASAARSVNGDPARIQQYLSGRCKTLQYGYVWKYKESE